MRSFEDFFTHFIFLFPVLGTDGCSTRGSGPESFRFAASLGFITGESKHPEGRKLGFAGSMSGAFWGGIGLKEGSGSKPREGGAIAMSRLSVPRDRGGRSRPRVSRESEPKCTSDKEDPG